MSVGHAHGCPRKHITGAHQYRVADFFGKFVGVLDLGESFPKWLVHFQTVKQGRELVTAFGAIDVFDVGSHDLDIRLLQF